MALITASHYIVTTSSEEYIPTWVSRGPPKPIQGELDEDHRYFIEFISTVNFFYLLVIFFGSACIGFKIAVRVSHLWR